MKPQIPWLRVFVEGVVIVGSILLAFGIQAWWDGAQERDRLRSVLVGIEAEFRSNRELLRFYEGKHTEAYESGLRLLALTGPQAQAPEDASALERDLYEILGWWIFTAEWGQLGSLATSGDLALIPDDSLRIALATWPDRVLQLNRVEEMAQLVSETLFIPFVQGRVPVRPAVASGIPEIMTAGNFAPDYRRLLRDPEFEGFIANRVWSLDAIIDNYVAVTSSLDHILLRIDGG